MFKSIDRVHLNDIYNCIPKEYKINTTIKDLKEITVKGKKEQKRKAFYKFRLDKKNYIHITLGYDLLDVFKKAHMHTI